MMVLLLISDWRDMTTNKNKTFTLLTRWLRLLLGLSLSLSLALTLTACSNPPKRPDKLIPGNYQYAKNNLQWNIEKLMHDTQL